MELITTYPVKKSDLGFHGNLFGGKLLSILDAAAVAYAMQLCDTPRMVTVSIDKCIFEKPNFLLQDYKIENIILKGKCKECNKNG